MTTCVRYRPHRFDTDSGWCLNGCGIRDDGHHEYRPGVYSRVPARDLTEPTHRKEDR